METQTTSGTQRYEASSAHGTSLVSDSSAGSSTVAQGRILACCIPLRGGKDGKGVECLLVSSRRCGLQTSRAGVQEEGERVHADAQVMMTNLVFPKGGLEADETLFEAAEREAFEEAGVSGRLETPHVDMFSYESLKDRQDKGGHTRQRTVYVFVLNVTAEHDEWPEKDSRSRVWVPMAEVRERLKHAWMQSAFDRLCAERGWI